MYSSLIYLYCLCVSFVYLARNEWVEEVVGEFGLQARSLSELRPRRLTDVQEGDRQREIHPLGLAPVLHPQRLIRSFSTSLQLTFPFSVRLGRYISALCKSIQGIPSVTGQPCAGVFGYSKYTCDCRPARSVPKYPRIHKITV